MAASAGSVFELIVDDRSPPLPHPRRDFAQSEKRPADVPIDWQIRSSAASTFGHTAPTAAAAASPPCMLNWFTLLALSFIWSITPPICGLILSIACFKDNPIALFAYALRFGK